MSSFLSSIAKTLSGDSTPAPNENNASAQKLQAKKVGDLNTAKLQSLRVKTPLSDASNNNNNNTARRHPKKKQVVLAQMLASSSPRSRTVQSLHQALLKMQEENATLKATLQASQDEMDRLTWELEALGDEKEGIEETLQALDQNAALETEDLWDQNQALTQENEQLARRVAHLELALNTTSRQAQERLHQILAGQEQLEQALEMVAKAKSSTPWWQCHE